LLADAKDGLEKQLAALKKKVTQMQEEREAEEARLNKRISELSDQVRN
jgi:hypothetical protein